MKEKSMADNKKMQQAKAVKNDEFYISSSWKLLSFRLDEGNDIDTRGTAFCMNGGVF